jgi:hypothetical protein
MPVTNKHDFRPWLLYASTTESMIPWDWLAESRDSAPCLSERERTEMLLQAVNGDWIPFREWTRLCGAPLKNPMLRQEGGRVPAGKKPIPMGGIGPFPGADPVAVTPPTPTPAGTGGRYNGPWDEQWIPLVGEAREPLRAALQALIREPETAVPEIAKNITSISSGRVLRVTEISERGVLRDRVIAHSIGAALIFALGLILDPHKPYRRQLRQCALPAPECGRFAFGDPPQTRGQPPNFYCSDEHRGKHRKQQNSERAAASRAGVSVEKYRKRKMKGGKQ